MRATERPADRRNLWQRRLVHRHGFSEPVARAYADLMKGKPD